MTYTLTATEASSITDVEVAFSTVRLLPPATEIPAGFIQGNTYTRLVEAIFFGWPLPDGDVELAEGVTVEMLNRVVQSHLGSFEPSHEHKIAGVGYMVSKLATIKASTR